jgi:hypothetical protein
VPAQGKSHPKASIDLAFAREHWRPCARAKSRPAWTATSASNVGCATLCDGRY